MARVTLQSLVGRRREGGPVIAQLLESMGAGLSIEDGAGAPAADQAGDAGCPVVHEGETLGWVRGPAPQAAAFAGLLAHLAARETEKKLLGAEVLNAYREINLINRFSEKLATLLDAKTVAAAAIEQAAQMLHATFGAVLLLRGDTGILDPIATLGGEVLLNGGIRQGEHLVGAMALKGNAEIVNDVCSDPRYGGGDPALCSMVCAPLKIKEQVRGVILLGSTDAAATYTAGDLKLLNTVALQTATALENAFLYEKTLQAAKAEALEATLAEVEEQKRRAEDMLLNILPESVAQELQLTGVVQPMYFEDVTVCFTDFVGFSKSTMTLAAEDVVSELHTYFTAFDRIIGRYGLEKLKTIGDSYMFVSGLPKRRAANPVDAVLAALEIVETVRSMGASPAGVHWKVRVGVHTGPVVAGVVGIRKFAFDIWGETVNLASRMESCSEPNRVNMSERTFARVKDFFAAEPRGRVKTKEGQDIEMYFVTGALERLMADRSATPPPAFQRRYQLYFKEQVPAFPEYLAAVAAAGG